MYKLNSKETTGDTINFQLFAGEIAIICTNCFKTHDNKNPYSYLSKYNQLPEILKDVEHVYIYGFAFSPVDVDYIDWIYKRVPNTCAWDVSWFTEKDRSRIDAFVFEHWDLKERINYVRLDDLNENY